MDAQDQTSGAGRRHLARGETGKAAGKSLWLRHWMTPWMVVWLSPSTWAEASWRSPRICDHSVVRR